MTDFHICSYSMFTFHFKPMSLGPPVSNWGLCWHRFPGEPSDPRQGAEEAATLHWGVAPKRSVVGSLLNMFGWRHWLQTVGFDFFMFEFWLQNNQNITLKTWKTIKEFHFFKTIIYKRLFSLFMFDYQRGFIVYILFMMILGLRWSTMGHNDHDYQWLILGSWATSVCHRACHRFVR